VRERICIDLSFHSRSVLYSNGRPREAKSTRPPVRTDSDILRMQLQHNRL